MVVLPDAFAPVSTVSRGWNRRSMSANCRQSRSSRPSRRASGTSTRCHRNEESKTPSYCIAGVPIGCTQTLVIRWSNSPLIPAKVDLAPRAPQPASSCRRCMRRPAAACLRPVSGVAGFPSGPPAPLPALLSPFPAWLPRFRPGWPISLRAAALSRHRKVCAEGLETPTYSL